MGHRIELEEIQLTLDQTEGVTRSCCIYGGAGAETGGILRWRDR